MMFHNIFLSFIILKIQSTHQIELNEIFSWKTVEFDWPSPDIKVNAIKNKNYIPENNVPVGLAIWKDKIFITVPRWRAGVASTLNYVKIQENKSPLLIPYPSWEANQIGNGTSNYVEETQKDSLPIGSVMRVWVDECDRLWVLDDGINGILGERQKVVDRSILIFDLNTNRLIKRHFFKHHSLTERPFIVNIDDSSWLIRHIYLHPNPLAGEFIVEGVRVHWSDGVIGLTLGNIRDDGYRTLYFHPLSSTTQFEVSTQTIQNKTWATSKPAFDDFKVTGERGPKTQSTTSCFDSKTGVIVYTQLTPNIRKILNENLLYITNDQLKVNNNGLACWKSDTEYNPSNIISFVQDAEIFTFPCDIKIDISRQLWILSNRLPIYFIEGHDQTKTNIRISRIDLDMAIKGTQCKLNLYTLKT